MVESLVQDRTNALFRLSQTQMDHPKTDHCHHMHAPCRCILHGQMDDTRDIHTPISTVLQVYLYITSYCTPALVLVTWQSHTNIKSCKCIYTAPSYCLPALVVVTWQSHTYKSWS